MLNAFKNYVTRNLPEAKIKRLHKPQTDTATSYEILLSVELPNHRGMGLSPALMRRINNPNEPLFIPDVSMLVIIPDDGTELPGSHPDGAYGIGWGSWRPLSRRALPNLVRELQEQRIEVEKLNFARISEMSSNFEFHAA